MRMHTHFSRSSNAPGAATPRSLGGPWPRRLIALLCLICLMGMQAPTESTMALASSAPASPAAAPPLSPVAVPASRAAQRLAVLTIEGPIDSVTASSVKRRLQAAIDGGADGIVFDLNTPGGEVGAVLDICTMIKQSSVHNTIAWINPTAYSGGAIIALACREIVLAPAATMGDAAPVAGDPINFARGLQATERQKILAPLLAEIVDSARLRGYDEKLVQGFVSLGVELWRIRDKRSGSEYFVDEGEYRALFGASPARGTPHIASGSVSSNSAPGIPDAALTPDEDGFDAAPADAPNRSARSIPAGEDDALAFRPASPSLTRDAMPDPLSMKTPTTRPSFTSDLRDSFEVIEYATDGRTLLTLKEGDLRRFGFAEPALTIANDQELKQHTGAQHLVRLSQSWSETLVSFMTQGMSGLIVRGLLIIIFLLSMFIEMSMPGVGLPGAIALVALAALVVPPMLIGASTWWALATILGGVFLIMLELFVLPGLGIPGVLGLVMLFAGLVGTFAGAGQLFPGSGIDGGSPLAWAASVVMLAGFAAGVGIFFFVRYTDKFPVAGRLVLADRAFIPDERDPTMLEAMAPSPGAALLVPVGAVGSAISPLRPSGSAEFGDKLVDVVSAFGFIETGTPVRVTSVTEYRVVVERVHPESPTAPLPASDDPAPPDAAA